MRGTHHRQNVVYQNGFVLILRQFDLIKTCGATSSLVKKRCATASFASIIHVVMYGNIYTRYRFYLYLYILRTSNQLCLCCNYKIFVNPRIPIRGTCMANEAHPSIAIASIFRLCRTINSSTASRTPNFQACWHLLVII